MGHEEIQQPEPGDRQDTGQGGLSGMQQLAQACLLTLRILHEPNFGTNVKIRDVNF